MRAPPVRRILIVEDSPTQAVALGSVLESAGYLVTSARSAEAALALLQTTSVDMVISDVVMPGLTGYELCRMIKRNPATHDLPFVLLTSLADPLDVVRGLEYGADNYVTKPYDDDHLLARVAHVFETVEGRRGRARGGAVDITFLGTHFSITSEREQILDLLISSFEEIVRGNAALRAARVEAEEARQRAEESNRAKSEFLAMMSHDLRTPLNAIGGYSELLALGVHGPMNVEQLKFLDRISRSQQHLLALVNDVLSFTPIERGQIPLKVESLLVDAVIRPLGALIEPQVEQRGIRYEYGRCDATLRMYADRERIEQIIINLLGNAVKFTTRGGVITVGCEAQEEAIAIHVADTGIGIAADKLQVIFDPFTQLEPSSAGSREGVGLGLAISRRLARLMGGDLTVTSTEGAGSTFTLCIPYAH